MRLRFWALRLPPPATQSTSSSSRLRPARRTSTRWWKARRRGQRCGGSSLVIPTAKVIFSPTAMDKLNLNDPTVRYFYRLWKYGNRKHSQAEPHQPQGFDQRKLRFDADQVGHAGRDRRHRSQTRNRCQRQSDELGQLSVRRAHSQRRNEPVSHRLHSHRRRRQRHRRHDDRQPRRPEQPFSLVLRSAGQGAVRSIRPTGWAKSSLIRRRAFFPATTRYSRLANSRTSARFTSAASGQRAEPVRAHRSGRRCDR